MKLEYRLRRKPADRAVSALYFEHVPVLSLLQTCAKLGLDPAYRTFRVADGLLVKLDSHSPTLIASDAIRLWAVAPNLLVPIDAELVPSLLEDEAAGLTRDRGLVFLPNREPLAFDPNNAVETNQLLAGRRRRVRPWMALPGPRRLATRIEEILVTLPGNALDPNVDERTIDDAVFDPEKTDVGSEPRRPEASGPVANLTGSSLLGAGRWVLKLGQAFGFKGLAALGANMIRHAMEIAPRLGESVLGAQEAALRALLKEFREGNAERAMRHALPLNDPAHLRGAEIDRGASLPTHNLKYTLDDMLSGNDRGPGRVWIGGQSLINELAREYRQAAEQALRQGDHRRAAFIYGKLLHDYRMAAHTLLRGGLYRDAAAVFLARLGDTRSAALALESAGDVDGALKLYRSNADHVAAGDLLRKIGEEEAALGEFQIAAERLASSNAGPLAAGDLLISKTGRTDLAQRFFQAGWNERPARNAILCAHRLAQIFADQGRVRDLFDFLAEADAFFLAPGQDQAAGLFYNELVCLADVPRMAEAREDLRDHALMSLATKVRQNERADVRPGNVLAALFGQPGVWSPALLTDAEFALTAALRAVEKPCDPVPLSTPSELVRVGSSAVTATCSALISGEILLGYENGDVYCYRPATSEIALVGTGNLPVISLAVDSKGRYVVVLRAEIEAKEDPVSDAHPPDYRRYVELYPTMTLLETYERRADGSYRRALSLEQKVAGPPWITPIHSGDSTDVFGLSDGNRLEVMEVTTLTPVGATVRPEWGPINSARLLPWPERPGYSIAFQEGLSWSRVDARNTGNHEPVDIPLQGQVISPAPLRPRPGPLELWGGGSRLEVAWIGPYGTLFWAALSVADRTFERTSRGTSAERGGYRAATILRQGLVAGIAGDRVDWFWGGTERLRHFCTNHGGLINIVAGFPCRLTGELVLVSANGYIRRIFVPS